MIDGDRLSELRKDMNMTQEDLAKRVFTKRETISLYERRLRDPPIGTIIKFTKIFGVSADYLLGLPDVSTYNGAIILPSDVPILKKVMIGDRLAKLRKDMNLR